MNTIHLQIKLSRRRFVPWNSNGIEVLFLLQPVPPIEDKVIPTQPPPSYATATPFSTQQTAEKYGSSAARVDLSQLERQQAELEQRERRLAERERELRSVHVGSKLSRRFERRDFAR